MAKSVLYEGPDISYHNGVVDIKRVRDSGCKRIGIRAGYGKGNVDQKFVANALACYNLDVDVLLYWFSYAYNESMAANEAAYAVAQAEKYWTCCPIAFDFEYDSVNYARKNGVNVTKQLATDMAVAFLKVVKNRGYIPVLYTNRDYMLNYFDIEQITEAVGEVFVWYARYTNSISESEQDVTDIWQYTSINKVDGISGNVDMNKFYSDLTPVEKTFRITRCNINIQDFQIAANADGYLDSNGNKLAIDGIDGPLTQSVRNEILLTLGSKGDLVKWWQRRCNEILGHSQKEDGFFGSLSRAETILLQQKMMLVVDGIVGYNSIQSVFYN